INPLGVRIVVDAGKPAESVLHHGASPSHGGAAGVGPHFDYFVRSNVAAEGMNEPAVARVILPPAAGAHALTTFEVRKRIGGERTEKREESGVGPSRSADAPTETENQRREGFCAGRESRQIRRGVRCAILLAWGRVA